MTRRHVATIEPDDLKARLGYIATGAPRMTFNRAIARLRFRLTSRGSQTRHYRGYVLRYEGTTGPWVRSWSYCHPDYDGAPDSHDHRAGIQPTLAACLDDIDELEHEKGTP